MSLQNRLGHVSVLYHDMMPLKSHICSPLHIGTIEISNRVIQAPMAGISTRAFRLQARRFGAGLAATEMISSHGVHYRNRRTLKMLELAAGEHPVSVQLFGSQPDIMAEAATEAAAAGADIIDINMGCPVRKVVATGAGAAMMADEKLAADITRAVVAAVPVPVTAKIRSGPVAQVTAISLAQHLEDAGIAALCVHPRLGIEGRKGRADHRVTAAVAERLEIPVIASGDIDGTEPARRLLDEYGCAAVMVGRAALGNPWLFRDILAGEEPRRRPLPEVLEEMGVFFEDLRMELGDERAGRFMRKFYGWYLKPFRPGARLRVGLRTVSGFEEASQLIEAAFPDLCG